MKKIIKFILSIILICVLCVAGYCGYILISYERIGDIDLEVFSNSSKDLINTDETYKISTYNIGFGAYSQDFTFFLDTGYDEEGKETCGYYSKAKSKDEVLFNINGSINTMKQLDLDFIILQEVDVKSTRSHKIDQNKMFIDEFKDYDSVFACNFDTAYLPYPFYDMHGKSLSGITTLSKYKIYESYRKEYSISEDLSKLFDLDRCFSISKVLVNNGKTLYIVNSHMSAYDKGGIIKKKQVEEINNFLLKCKENGDYVIFGGDFNHDLLTYNPDFNYSNTNKPFANRLRNPDWIASYFDNNGNSPLINGFKVIASDNVPTCRNNDIIWDLEITYRCVVDGFIISDNIEVVNHYNVETKNGNLGINGFAFSDHQPAYLEFKLL